MAKRYFLQKAKDYRPSKHGVGGLWYGKKLDGHRGFWDGGISKGIPKSEIPWANTAKDYRYKKIQIATGLWTPNGNVVHAPDWWTHRLPLFPLDGEFWNPILRRQDIGSIVKSLDAGDRWKDIQIYCYDIPPLETIFSDGFIDTPHFSQILDEEIIMRWIASQDFVYDYWPNAQSLFRKTYQMLKNFDPYCASMVALPQYELPFQTSLAQKHLDHQLLNLKETEDGLIIRHPDKIWMPEKVEYVLKVKPFDDDEGTVMGYITGRETDKGSRLLGMMGALILDYKGKRLELSGFTDEERKLTTNQGLTNLPSEEAVDWAIHHPETECPHWIDALHFSRGDLITFKYRGLTKDEIPQEARYWRGR